MDDSIKSKRTSFVKELRELINRYSKENCSNTPDFILAEYLEGCLKVYGKAVLRRDQWMCSDQSSESSSGDCLKYRSVDQCICPCRQCGGSTDALG
jgi:hypothetical protein